VLPTSGTARFSSPLGVTDFQKRSSLIEVSEAGANALGPIAAELAYGEGLQAHARAAEMRLTGGVEPLPAPASGFSLRPVTSDNVDRLVRLAVAEGQRSLVASVATSLAQAAYRPTGRPLAICDGDDPVGLLLLWDARRDPDDPADQLYVWRLSIDAKHQRRGFGLLAMRWAIDEARRMGVASVGLSHRDEPGHAGPFYEKLGFCYTGEVDGAERVMVFNLGEA
jgi:histidinol dehydrogenase